MVRSLHTPAYEIFRRLLVEVRERQGMTQVDLAKRLGRPQSFISKYENGERRLDVIEFISICDALEVEAAVLFKSVVGAISEH
ncbi:helix-turn-helix domain-containing protein [Pseudomonas parafulva]|uniref:Transcriptional regulator n=1 Tax=Pseudomonas parafulva TaxID=157782 RepID=A0ABM6J6Z9_9PSED|nr:helix-turn-helix transcriptional regulator [Pseudomonas parafulva]AQW70234.1 transcriptional regulator [Pseudomonas parafulva]